MKYECSECNKVFRRNEHLKTHINKKKKCINKKSFDCDKCHKSFSTKSNLNKHKNVVCIKYEHDNDSTTDNLNNDSSTNELTNDQIEQIKTIQTQFNNQLNELIKHLTNQNNVNVNQTINNDNSTNINNHINNNNNVSLLQYVNEHCKSGPPMLALENYDIIKNKEILVDTKESIDMRFIRTLSEQYEFNKLTIYLGDIITTFYKKDKQNEQTFFSSDVSRLTFLTKILPMGATNIKWISDKTGELVKTHVIRPLLNYIEQSMTIFRQLGRKSVVNYNDIHLNLVQISTAISNKSLENSIARYIAPKFTLNQLSLTN
jgi:hypothetical protein